MKSLFQVRAHSFSSSVGLLALRAVAGVAMALHGWPKIQAPLTWMGEGATMPGYLQAAAAVAEFGGGICWVLGLLMPLASLGLVATMGVAVHLHVMVLKHPFVSKGEPSYELAALYLALALLFLLSGPGKLSADTALFGSKGK